MIYGLLVLKEAGDNIICILDISLRTARNTSAVRRLHKDHNNQPRPGDEVAE